MQLILLTVISLFFALCAVTTTQKWIKVRRTRRTTIFLTALGTVLNAAGTVVFEGLLKAGRPTLYYHTHAPGPVTLKIFLTGAALASLVFAVGLYFCETKIRKMERSGSLFWLLTKIIAVSLLLSSILELGVFNYRHYELIGFDKPKVVFERGSYQKHGFYFNRASQKFTSYSIGPNGVYGFTLYTDNKKIRNLLLDFDNGQPQTRIQIGYTDETFESPIKLDEHILIEEIPESYHIPLNTVGGTYRIQITFPEVTGDELVEFSMPSITINQVVPLDLSPVRFGLAFIAFFLLLCFRPGSPLYGIRLDLKSVPQRLIIVLLLLACSGWYAWTTFSSYTGSDASFTEQKAQFSQSYRQYNQLVEALLIPRYALVEAPNKDIINAERPYDKTYRDAHDIYYAWDTVFYNQAYYVYFGIVPAVTVLLPWKVLTGEFLELDYATLFFCCLGLIGLYGLYSRIIPRKFPGIPFSLYLIGFMLLVCVLNLTWCLRRGLVYELAVCSGFCFIVWAVFLTWRACETGRLSNILLFGGGLTAALAVGCRPTLLLVSLLIPFIVIPAMKRSGKLLRWRNVFSLAAFAVPYGIIGLILMKYNFERFGNVFEFGIHYQLTEANESVVMVRTGFWGTMISLLHYLFTPCSVDMSFPFLHLKEIHIPYNGFLLYERKTIGLFSYPLLWFLFLMGKFRKSLREKGLLTFCIVCIVTGLALCAACSFFSVTTRYLVDFAWLFGLPAVIVLFCCWEHFAEKGMQNWVAGAAVICLAAGIVIFVGLSLTGEGDWFEKINPVYFNRLAYQYEFWK